MNIRRTELGAAIRRLRLARGLKLADVAYAADTDPGNISRLERGQQGYSDHLLAAIADTFNLRLWELFREAENLPAHQVREEHGRYGAFPTKSLQRLNQRYTQTSPAARKLVDALVGLAASGKLSDEVCYSFLTLLRTQPTSATKKVPLKKHKRTR